MHWPGGSGWRKWQTRHPNAIKSFSFLNVRSLQFYGFVHIKGSLRTTATLYFCTCSEKPRLCLCTGLIQCVSSPSSKGFLDVGAEEGWELQKLTLFSLNLCPHWGRHASGENRGYAWAAEHLWPHDLWVLYSGKCILQLICFFIHLSFPGSFCDTLVFSLVLLCCTFKKTQLSLCWALIKCLETAHSNARDRERKQNHVHSYPATLSQPCCGVKTSAAVLLFTHLSYAQTIARWTQRDWEKCDNCSTLIAYWSYCALGYLLNIQALCPTCNLREYFLLYDHKPNPDVLT